MPPSPFPTASAQDTASTVSASSAHNIDKGAIAVAAATLAVNAVPAITKVITAANEVSGNDIAVETSLNDLSNAVSLSCYSGYPKTCF